VAKKKDGGWFTWAHGLMLAAVCMLFAVVFVVFNQGPAESDNVLTEFGDYEAGAGFGNNYFAGACNEGGFETRFYTMSGVTGNLRRIIVPVEVQDDPEAMVVGEVKICEAELGGSCTGEEKVVKSNFEFTYEWGFESGEKSIELSIPFFVRAGSYYMITVDGFMNGFVTYSMYKADVDSDANRYFHSAPGCSSSRTDVYVVHFSLS